MGSLDGFRKGLLDRPITITAGPLGLSPPLGAGTGGGVPSPMANDSVDREHMIDPPGPLSMAFRQLPGWWTVGVP